MIDFVAGLFLGAGLVILGIVVNLSMMRAFGLEVVRAFPRVDTPTSVAKDLTFTKMAAMLDHEEPGDRQTSKDKRALDDMAEAAATKVRGLRTVINDPLVDALREVSE